MSDQASQDPTTKQNLATLTARGTVPKHVRSGGGMAALDWFLDQADPEAIRQLLQEDAFEVRENGQEKGE